MSATSTPSLAAVFAKLLTPQECEDFELNGYAVFQNALPPTMAKQFLSEIKMCFEGIEGGKTPNAVEFRTESGAVKLTKPHIFECDLHQTAIRRQLPLFDSLFERQLSEVVTVLQDRLYSCEDLVNFDGASSASQALTLKLQMNEGGAFPWHYDNPSRPNKRRLTLAVYLTEDWQPDMGGELQLMPFLGPCVSVPPAFNTVALFKSDVTLHKVLPVRAEVQRTRYCFTVWFDGHLTNSDEDQFLRTTHLQESAIPFLKRSPVQRILARAVYEREFREALEACFGKDTPSLKVSLLEHEARLKQLLSTEQVRQFVAVLKEYREDKAPA